MPGYEVDQTSMLDFDALRQPARSRGVDHVSQVVGLYTTRRVLLTVVGHRTPICIQTDYLTPALGQSFHQVLLGQ